MYDIREVNIGVVEHLFIHHPYKSTGKVFVYCFAVYEEDKPVAVYAFNPPPFGAAKSVCEEEPQAVLCLVRMVALPKNERRLKHISKPLMYIMKNLIDRTRYPVIISYSDSQYHTGHTYKCSGFIATTNKPSKTYNDENGARVSRYSGGKIIEKGTLSHTSMIQRWEKWACNKGEVVSFMNNGGWKRIEIDGKWASGNSKHKIVKTTKNTSLQSETRNAV